jgi:Tol biopolymer transport system component
LSAIAEDAGGRPVSNSTPTWQSSAPAVATVDEQGVVTAVTRGEATITARVGSVVGTARVTVRDPFVRIAIERLFPSVFSDDTTLLAVVAFDSSGAQVELGGATWSSADPSVATIGRSGIATGRQAGLVRLRAQVGQSSDSIDLAVVPKRIRPSREIAFIQYQNATSIDGLLLTDGNRSELVSSPDRYVHSFGWSPDGSLLAISYVITKVGQNPLLEIVDVSAGTRRSLSISGVFPDISPDNTRVAFLYFNGVDQVIATMGVDGSGLRYVDELPGHELVPRWSPDGRQIAFLSNPGPAVFQLWIMNADGRFPRRISTSTLGRNHAWSPDGKLIAYDDGDRVWLANPETAQVRSLSPPGVAGYPEWSPDGTRIGYGADGAMRVVRLDGSTVRDIPASGGPTGAMIGSFSSDGTKLAVVRDNGSFAIFAVDIGTGAAVQVSEGNSWFPWWRP